jgi:hypothetical protein
MARLDSELGDWILLQVTKAATRKKLKPVEIEAYVTGVQIERTIRGASTVTVTLQDVGWKLTNSGLFLRQTKNGKDKLNNIDLQIDDRWFTLVGFSITGQEVTLTFEDRAVNYLRQHKRNVKWHRSAHTRAEYVHHLVRAVKANGGIGFYSPDEHDVRPQKTLGKAAEDPQDRTDARSKGIAYDELDGKYSKAQIDAMNTALDVATQYGVGPFVFKAMVVAGLGESQFDPSRTDYKTHTHKGVFQSNQIDQYDTKTQAYHFLHGGRSFREGGAIQAHKDNPSWSVGQIAQYVEISDGQESYYNGFADEADKIIEAYGGASSGGTTLTEVDTEFRVEDSEDYWDTIQRLAEEVQYAAFVDTWKVGNKRRPVLIFMPEKSTLWVGEGKKRHHPQSLITAKKMEGASRNVLTDPDIVRFNATVDEGQDVDSMEIDILCSRWAFRPGTTFAVKGIAPLAKKWIVESISRDISQPYSTLTLVQPRKDKKEPVESQQTDSRTTPASLANGLTKAQLNGHPRPHKKVSIVAAAILNQYPDFRISCTTDHDTYTNNGKVSDHVGGLAVDIVGTDPTYADLDDAAKWIHTTLKKYLKQGIHKTGLAVNNGQDVDGPTFFNNGTWEQHRNHIHIAVADDTDLDLDTDDTPDETGDPDYNQPISPFDPDYTPPAGSLGPK